MRKVLSSLGWDPIDADISESQAQVVVKCYLELGTDMLFGGTVHDRRSTPLECHISDKSLRF